MDIKKDRKLIKKAIDQGCKTAAELAHFIRVYSMLDRAYRTV